MAKYTKIVSKEGDRWDLVAHRAYGDASNMTGIIGANPNVPLGVEIAPGTELYIPIIDQPEQDKSNLPPWRRAQ
jgi:hypothetical protein